MNDDFLPNTKKSQVALLAQEDLEILSVFELEERIAALKAEIARSDVQLVRARKNKAAADSLFKKSDWWFFTFYVIIIKITPYWHDDCF